ncbi:MAG: prepilin-type N-terminal cleavage/methylation domain-containing protein [Akkermansiaceae bacterium]|nr:prepilin-type N-terminal cleavage/methylation domain-containing protein [Akkermansiaceae bacterium]
MKTQLSRRESGFTLVELLVVIAIIAVLAGAGFAAGNAAIQKAKKTTALATCVALETAVNNFSTEYGSMPTTQVVDTKVDTVSNVPDFLNVVLGIETASAPLNTRAIKFLSAKEGKGNKNGLIYNSSGTTVTGLFDPWGGTYKVMLDCDYDEKVAPRPKGGGTMVTLNGRKAAAWSDGADGALTAAGATTDDVKTW